MGSFALATETVASLPSLVGAHFLLEQRSDGGKIGSLHRHSQGGVRRKGEEASVFKPLRDLCHGEAHHRSWEGIMREPDLMLQGYRILQISEIGLLHKDP